MIPPLHPKPFKLPKTVTKYFILGTVMPFPERNLYKHPNWYCNKLDKNGNLIWESNSKGGWKEWEYDDNNQETYYNDCWGQTRGIKTKCE